MRTKISQYCKQYCGGACGAKTSGFREVCWFHLLISSSTTTNQRLALFRTSLSLFSSPRLPADWNLSWVVIFSLSFNDSKLNVCSVEEVCKTQAYILFYTQRTVQGNARISETQLQTQVHSSNNVEGRPRTFPWMGGTLLRTDLLLNSWYWYIFPLTRNKVYYRNRLLGLPHWV